MSDIVVLSSIVIFFVVLGAVVPFIHADFGQTTTDLNTKGLEGKSGQGVSESTVSAISVTLSIFTMFFWTFGNIPVIIDLVLFVPLRVILAILSFKLIRGVGG